MLQREKREKILTVIERPRAVFSSNPAPLQKKMFITGTYIMVMRMMVVMIVVDVMMAYLNASASARQSWRLMTAQSQASMVANTIPKNLEVP